MIVDALDGHQIVDIIPPRPKPPASDRESINLDQPWKSNPKYKKVLNTFDLGDARVVIQDPLCI